MTGVDGHPAGSPLLLTGPDDAGVLNVQLVGSGPENRVPEALHAALAALWPGVAARRDVRCVLLRGAPGGFGGGSDAAFIRSVTEAGGDRRAQLHIEARDIVLGALDCEVPIVAAVRGAAVGAALSVALLADVCVVADDARIADGHARIGVGAGDHAVLVWPLLCGMAQAKRRLLLPEVLSGRQAHDIGLVAEVAPDDRVDAVAQELARRLADQAALATRFTRRALNHWFRLGLPAFESSLAHEMLTYDTAAAREGIASLVEQRPPRFREVER
jgi:enoyl-CoA hydratase